MKTHTKGTCSYCGAQPGNPCTVTLLNNETLSVAWNHRAREIYNPPKTPVLKLAYVNVMFI